VVGFQGFHENPFGKCWRPTIIVRKIKIRKACAYLTFSTSKSFTLSVRKCYENIQKQVATTFGLQLTTSRIWKSPSKISRSATGAGGLGAYTPRKFLKSKCFEIESGSNFS